MKPIYSHSEFTSVEGPRLRLLRLRADHLESLFKNLFNPESWFGLQRGIHSNEKFMELMTKMLGEQNEGKKLTVVVQEVSSGELVAMSTYHSATPEMTGLEIGFTWIGDSWQRTYVNTEKKYLMLKYAFEVIGVKRVQFAVDPTNDKSNKAMKRIGATLEGTLRKWRFLSESDKGHRNIYSFIDEEWPEAKARFELLMKGKS